MSASEELGKDQQRYAGSAIRILEKFGSREGQRIKVETIDGLVTSGLLLPRYEHADTEHIVLKLKSGYNIGLKASKIKSILVIDEQTSLGSDFERGSGSQKRALPGEKTREELMKQRKKLLLISTGGTIASRIDYRTGAVHPALSASDLYSAIPELDEIARIEPEVVFSVYSENIGPKHWGELSQTILQRTRDRSPQGLVVMIGTDTLAYVSAALSFSLIGLKLPVVLVGAQRSTDRPSSDGALNLKAACTFAVNSRMPGVFVAMHETENDDFIAIHSGARVRKNHTSRRDAFESIDVPLVARIKGNDIISVDGESQGDLQATNQEQKVSLKTEFDDKVALVKFHPEFDYSVLDFLTKERGVRGVIIEGTGLGHVSSGTVKKISELTKNGVFVGIASQCIWGRVDLNVYDTGRDMISAGAVPLENMIAETAFVKLSWALANFEDVKQVMLANLVGEFAPRTVLNS